MSNPSFWITIGLNFEAQQIILAGCAKTKAQAEKIGVERKEADGERYDKFGTFFIDDQLGGRLVRWFANNGMNDEIAKEGVRGIGEVLLRCLDDSGAHSRRTKLTRTPESK